MTLVTRRLTAKSRDQLRDPTFGNRVWATFTFFRLSHRSAAAAVAAGFAAERPVGRRCRSIASSTVAAHQLQTNSAATAPQHGAQQQMRAVSRTHVDSRGTRLNTNLLSLKSRRVFFSPCNVYAWPKKRFPRGIFLSAVTVTLTAV